MKVLFYKEIIKPMKYHTIKGDFWDFNNSYVWINLEKQTGYLRNLETDHLQSVRNSLFITRENSEIRNRIVKNIYSRMEEN